VTHDVGEALYLADEIVPVVAGRIDREWMERTAAREPAAGDPARAASREPRLSLAY
jgi:molybdate transport system ATP-binding protein